MAAGDDAYRLLRDMNVKLDTVIEMLSKRPAAAPSRPVWGGGGKPSVRDVPHIAPDKDLDSKFGDPEVRAKSPRDWTGPPMQGKHFSECPSEYLILVAERLDYFAEQNAGDPDPEAQKKAHYNRLDASRARGWAQRNKGKTTPRKREPGDDDGPTPFDDSDIAF